jgi:hypothetical protein
MFKVLLHHVNFSSTAQLVPALNLHQLSNMPSAKVIATTPPADVHPRLLQDHLAQRMINAKRTMMELLDAEPFAKSLNFLR